MPLVALILLSLHLLDPQSAAAEESIAALSVDDFAEKDMPPASFIFSAEHLWPPYDIDVDVMEPAKRCDSMQAHLCGIQHSIRLVTQARLSMCPELAAGGLRRAASLQNVSAGYYSTLAPSSTGFDIFIFDQDGFTLADGLHPELVGEHVIGKNVSGAVLQPQLLHHVDWVVKWNGGFVPHFSKRLQDGDPIVVVTYVEACPGTGDRIGVSMARQNTRVSTSCTSDSDQKCAQHNNEALQGLALLELLTATSSEEFSAALYKFSYTEDFTMNGFGVVVSAMSWFGYPGDDSERNPAPLPDTYETILANGHGPTMGLNLTDAYGVSNMTRSVVIDSGEAVWNGAGWIYTSDPIQVVLVAGVTWNRTLGVAVKGGVSHNPRAPVGGPLCRECPANFSLACSLVNAESLNVHARADLLVPDNSWDRLTYLSWFGAAHDRVQTLEEVGGSTWPDGFYVAAFSNEGICMAHAGNYSLVGQTAEVIFGNSDAHNVFLSATTFGERWMPFVDHGVPKLAHVHDLVRDGNNYYVVTAISRAWAPFSELPTCSASALEECSIWNAQALLGGAAGEIFAQYYEDEVLEVVRKMEAKEGPFASEFTGDFTVHLYDENFKCWEAAEAAGIPCPPEIATGETDLIRLAIGTAADPVAYSIDLNSSPVVAFVFQITWLPHRSFTSQDFYLAVFVAEQATTPICTSDDDCPKNSSCSSSGRCACLSSNSRTSFFTNVSLVLNECGRELVPTEMTCVAVDKLDCTDSSGNIDLSTCRPCEEGYFCSKGIATPCPRGQFCPPESYAPTPCARGSAANATGSASCSPCEVGTATSWAASFECSPCMAGTYAGIQGQSICETCPRDSYSISGQASCTPCPGGTYASSTGATSVSECRHCPEHYYFDNGECQECFWGLTAPASDATSCTLTPTSQVVWICAALIIALAAALHVISKRMYRKKRGALQRKDDLASAAKLQEAKDCAQEVQCPLAVMSLEHFLNLTSDQIALSYTEHRDNHRLLFLDSYDAIQAFKEVGHHLIYCSYERGASMVEVGVSSSIFSSFGEALLQATSRKGWDVAKTYIWIDRISVPQDHPLMRNLAIDSLYMYLKCADLLLMVCPIEAAHKKHKRSELGRLPGVDHLQSQAWCRAEVLAHCCTHELEDVLVFDDAGLRAPTLEWLTDMLYVFEGEFPCCSAGHRDRSEVCNCTFLLRPMLALFCDGIGPSDGASSPVATTDLAAKPDHDGAATSPAAFGRRFFQEMVLPQKDRVFPATLRFHYFEKRGKRCVEERDLFGDLIELAVVGRVSKFLSSGSRPSSPSISQDLEIPVSTAAIQAV